LADEGRSGLARLICDVAGLEAVAGVAVVAVGVRGAATRDRCVHAAAGVVVGRRVAAVGGADYGIIAGRSRAGDTLAGGGVAGLRAVAELAVVAGDIGGVRAVSAPVALVGGTEV